MGKEISADEKLSARARRSDRPKRISKRDSDNETYETYESKESVNALDEKQAAKEARRSSRQLRIPKRVPRDCDESIAGSSSCTEAHTPSGAFDVGSERSLSVNALDEKKAEKEARRSSRYLNRQLRNSRRNIVSGELDESNEGSNGNEAVKSGALAAVPDGILSVNALDGEQDAKARRSYRKQRNSKRMLLSGELDESDRNDDEQAQDVTKDNKPNLVFAAETSPDTADSEAQLGEQLNRQASEMKKQILEQPPSRRWCVCVLLGLLVVGGVVGVLVAFSEPAPVATMPTMTPTAVNEMLAPTGSPTTLSTSPKFTQLLNITSAVTSDIKLLQDPTTFQYAALDWLANEDGWWVDIDSFPPQVFVERYVLALLYFSTNGTSWRKDLNFLMPTPVCDWSGVTCDASDGIYGFDYVWRLDMDDNAMQGEIPTEIALLTSLNRLNFNKNTLFGTIPSEIYSLTNLVYLWVEDNALSGTLSTAIGNMSSLASLDLDNNDLKGTLPTEIAMLADLFEFELSYNNLGGSLPTEIATMTDLDRIGLRWNDFGGTVPTELGYLTALFVLDLLGNEFRGIIPTEFGALTAMQYFFLGMNLLEGQLPSELGRLEALEQFFVHDNRLTGSVPEMYQDLTNLEYFWFQGNDFRGSVDSIFCINPFVREDLRGDCLGDSPEITCTCCTTCCTADGETCEQP